MLKMTEKSKCLCNAKPFNEKKLSKPIAQISEKKKERLQTNWTELQLFKKRFELLKAQGKNYCMVTWVLLDFNEDDQNEDSNISIASFPHIANKNMFANLRYYLNNIWLVKWISEHKKFDEYISEYKDFYWVDNLIKDIENWKEVYIDILNFINNKKW